MKIQFIIAGLLLTSNLTAQITVNSSDFISVGDSFSTASSVTLSPNDIPGPNKTWNYSTLDTVNGTKSYTIVNPSTTTNGAQFSSSNLAQIDEDGEITYYNKTATSFELTGTDDGDLLIVSNPLIEFAFPLSYGNTNSDNFIAITTEVGGGAVGDPDSIRTTISGSKNYQVDSWGDLILPLGTFPALRIKDTLFISFLEEELNGGVWTTASQNYDTTFTNTFVSNNPSSRRAVLVQELDRNGNVTNVDWYYNRAHYAGINKIETNFSFSVFPNPVTNLLNIDSKSSFNEMVITDISGKLVLQKQNREMNKIDVSSLDKGSYILTLINKEGRTTKKFMKQ